MPSLGCSAIEWNGKRKFIDQTIDISSPKVTVFHCRLQVFTVI